MRIVVDATPLSVRRSGIGNYIRGSIIGLSMEGADVLALGFGPSQPIDTALRGISANRLVLSPPLANVLRRAWSAVCWPPLEHLVGRFDALLLSDWWHPPQRYGIRTAVVYDLVPLHFPEWVTRRTLQGHRSTYRHVLPRCQVLFAISNYTADDVARSLAIDRSRIHVAYPGVDERFRPDGGRIAGDVVTVATLEPRKNLETLLAAQSITGRELTVVGGAGWGGVRLRERPRVRHLGYVSDEDLPALLRGASCFVYPSRFEGFGMPIIEAMACGCPVVASSHPSLDEACGDAALRADPDSPEDFAAAIDSAIRYRDDLVRRGLAHARRFTWRATGRAILNALAEVGA